MNKSLFNIKSYDQYRYNLIKGDYFFKDKEINNLIWNPLTKYKQCDPDKIYKVVYFKYAGINHIIYNNICYINEYKELNDIIKENNKIKDLIFYICNKPFGRMQIITDIIDAYNRSL